MLKCGLAYCRRFKNNEKQREQPQPTEYLAFRLQNPQPKYVEIFERDKFQLPSPR